MFDLFQGLAKQGKTLVMVTHDPSLAKRVSRTVTIADGEVVQDTEASGMEGGLR
jgi:putative ABC transport system ATP-binding protein